MTLHVIAFLWFYGYTLPAIPHSPAVAAITALRLYLLQWLEFEKMANLNCQSTCGNRISSALLYEFAQGVKKGHCKWPEEWKANPQIKYPEFTDNCVLPSKFVGKKSEEMCRSDYQAAKESQTPQGRAKKILRLAALQRADSEEPGTSAEPSSPLKQPKSPDTNQNDGDADWPKLIPLDSQYSDDEEVIPPKDDVPPILSLLFLSVKNCSDL